MIHGDPATEYPFFLGHADERGAGAGTDFNLNLPLPRGTGYATWRAALDTALQAVADFGAQALVVPLGLDTFAGDPISGFTLQTGDYLAIGQARSAMKDGENFADIISSGKSFLPLDQTGCKLA